jgi:hypothetical protein
MDGDMTAVAAIGGTDIRAVMKSQGPIVNTVVLRCRSSASDENDDEKIDSKPAAIEETEAPCEEKGTENRDHEASTEAQEKPARIILSDLIEEVKIDTTPSKSKVAELLGGPFTFLGQYEDEGIVLMVRNFPDDLEADLKDIYYNSDQEEDDDNEKSKASQNKSDFSFSEQLSKNFNIKALKAVCQQRGIDTESMKEKEELVQALVDYQKRLPPYNKHQLQPPLHNARVRGEIVIMKVAETEEELDNFNVSGDKDDGASKKVEVKTDDDDNNDATDEKSIRKESEIDNNNQESKNAVTSVPSNDEFFLDYSKDAYIKFASRTDIPEHDIEIGDSDTEEERDEGGNGEASMMGVDDDDDDDDEEDSEESDKSAMFNLVMNEVLRQYREENGRGPNTKELLELRANIAKELGVEIAQEIDGDWDKMAKENSVPSAKKLTFTKEADRVREYVPDANEYPSDKDDEDYDDVDDSDDVARSLMDDYDEEDDDNHVNQPPTKRLKTSEDGDSKPAGGST